MSSMFYPLRGFFFPPRKPNQKTKLKPNSKQSLLFPSIIHNSLSFWLSPEIPKWEAYQSLACYGTGLLQEHLLGSSHIPHTPTPTQGSMKTPCHLKLHLGYITCRLLNYNVIEKFVIQWWHIVGTFCLSGSIQVFSSWLKNKKSPKWSMNHIHFILYPVFRCNKVLCILTLFSSPMWSISSLVKQITPAGG